EEPREAGDVHDHERGNDPDPLLPLRGVGAPVLAPEVGDLGDVPVALGLLQRVEDVGHRPAYDPAFTTRGRAASRGVELGGRDVSSPTMPSGTRARLRWNAITRWRSSASNTSRLFSSIGVPSISLSRSLTHATSAPRLPGSSAWTAMPGARQSRMNEPSQCEVI